MRVRYKNKRIFYIFIITIFATLSLYNTLLSLSICLFKRCPTSLHGSKSEPLNINNSNTITTSFPVPLIFDANKWVFNPPISQYSPKLISYPNGEIILETLNLCDYQNYNDALHKTSFIVRFTPNSQPILFKTTDATSLRLNIRKAPYLWRLRVKLTPEQHNFEVKNIIFAVIDHEQVNKTISEFTNKHEDDLNYLIAYHKPVHYDLSTIVVLKQVAHCVHMVREIESERFNRMLNWLEIQKRIGYQKIRMYMYRVSANVTRLLGIKAKSIDLDLEMIEYKFDFEVLCKYYIELEADRPNSTIRQHLVRQCRDYTSEFMDPTQDDVVNSHEQVCTNACMTHFKYGYEFMTNYDFDEILFPRKFKTNDYTIKSDSCRPDKKQLQYDIYQYATELVKTYGTNIGSFQFEHVLFFDGIDENFLKKVSFSIFFNLNYFIKVG